jgi:hypothetical protein
VVILAGYDAEVRESGPAYVDGVCVYTYGGACS